jgi:hypothetical protein
MAVVAVVMTNVPMTRPARGLGRPDAKQRQPKSGPDTQYDLLHDCLQ